ncbi:MAG: type II toxin-antitoxin system RelE/ParE family toxin [Gaiellales bacterium]|nr:type II toxin-antitoxin system RelE/ParE family toxin [Gaiellales bacterium]
MADVRFAAAAIVDVQLSRDWYEGEVAGLGEEFVDAVQAAASRVGLYPSAGSPIAGGLRRQFLERFPYVLYYRQDAGGIFVVACLHAARGPEHRMRRLRG